LGITRESLLTLLPAGGARNALDCALWDLESQLTGRPVWQLAGLQQPRPLWATFTCSADDPEKMAAAARSYVGAKAIKLKLTGEAADAARVEAVRDARPDVVLRVDANQGFTPATLAKLMPVLTAARVTLVEQPFPIGQDALLEDLESPIALAADESVQCLADIAPLVGRVSMINIKLDKCGGLTEALSMARAAHELGLDTMVGNMLGTSLAMAPGFLLGQRCKFVELDGPIALSADRVPAARFLDGFISCPESLWGYPRSSGASPQAGG
jgi:L-alanine-DL-glutamate epimerase-like enolase superfamily enzyme